MTQEGASLLLPHMRKRVVWLEPADFGLCVHGGQVFFEALSEEARAALSPLEPGALICAERARGDASARAESSPKGGARRARRTEEREQLGTEARW